VGFGMLSIPRRTVPQGDTIERSGISYFGEGMGTLVGHLILPGRGARLRAGGTGLVTCGGTCSFSDEGGGEKATFFIRKGKGADALRREKKSV